MLKWTASAQKLALNTPPMRSVTMRTPRHSSEMKRRRRRATIADKENLEVFNQPCTSTPMVPRLQLGGMQSSPLSDILNVTPELPPETPRSSMKQSRSRLPNRRHSHVGFLLPVVAAPYATTLPRYIEEEYSPGAAAMVLPTGQQLALRGLLPDPFLCNARYFANNEEKQLPKPATTTATKPQKRKLEQEFVEAAQEDLNATKKSRTSLTANVTNMNSTKMGDHTLDKLIDAILDSARKDEKKKKPRKSFNLRRRTLLRNHAEVEHTLMLSPSYTAGDDPASDLSFLNVESAAMATIVQPLQSTLLKQQTSQTPAAPKPKPTTTSPPTPKPVTPLPGCTQIPSDVLRQMPTPKLTPVWLRSRKSLTDSFNLVTPPPSTAMQKCHKRLSLNAKPANSFVPKHACKESTPTSLQNSGHRKRRQSDLQHDSVAISTRSSVAKKFKIDAPAHSYFEIGLALPSIYV